MNNNISKRIFRTWMYGGILLLTISVMAYLTLESTARAASPAKPDEQASPLHPEIELLDQNSVPVLESGEPISPMKTCGSCHDAEFIAGHSFHASAGLESFGAAGSLENGREWDSSAGLFGRWNPLTYRFLTPQGEAPLDLTTPDWLKSYGYLFVGGGPAVTSRNRKPLTELAPDAANLETATIDAVSGKATPWDWNESGVAEMNCFLCHIPQPNEAARRDALAAGRFGAAATATLLGNGIVDVVGDTFTYNPAAFNEDGEVEREFIQIQDPTNDNCGTCHGVVHEDPGDPLVASTCGAEDWRFSTTGQIYSPQRISASGLNVSGKEKLSRTWDVHAERIVNCTDCHFSLNNPVYDQNSGENQPDHLTFDPRRLELGEYLYQPLHQFARGASAQSTIAPNLMDTMRTCESCHSIDNTHDWLPYKDRHVAELSCESCHIPQVYFSALQTVDWTSVTPNGKPLVEYRGVEACPEELMAGGAPTTALLSSGAQVNTLITGYTPVLLPRSSVDGSVKLAPYNLVTTYYWVYGDPARPVPLADLQAAWLDGNDYAAEVVSAFDTDSNSLLSDAELVIDNESKASLISGRLAARGLDGVRLSGEVLPYSINHTVSHGEWATQDCQVCHSRNSRLKEAVQLAAYTPAGTKPEFVQNTNTVFNGTLVDGADGALYYLPDTVETGLYIFGANNVRWIDILGSLAFAGVLAAIGAHGMLRLVSAARRPKHSAKLNKVYMYTVYERLWHWLQTFTILLLLFTGLIIHRPDTFSIFSFRYVVLVHNILAAVLVVNAFLSFFYHLASGEIKQFIPRLGGFFDDAIEQGLYYLRGIFAGQAHPFEKTPSRKMNPLQQVTYLAILNVLLPAQVITGILMWGVQRFPELAKMLGGLPVLAPLHTLVAWLFATFIAAHVYLTTTAHTPIAGIRAMMMGWDEVEVSGIEEPDPRAAPVQEQVNSESDVMETTIVQEDIEDGNRDSNAE